LTSFHYDQLNRRIGEADILTGGGTLNLAYGYDADGNLITEAQTGLVWNTVTYQYDAADRITGASNTDGQSVKIAYDGFGDRVQLTLGNGVVETIAYDSDGRVTGIGYSTVGNAGATQASNITYVRDAGGLPTQIVENLNGAAATLNLTLDAMGRVTTVSGPTGRNESFGYDLDGNLVSSGSGGTLTVNSADETVSSSSGASFSSDSQGNVTVDREPDGSRTEMRYDASKPQWEFPRLCRGGSKSLTYPAVDTAAPSTKLRIVSHQAHEEGVR
jgi:YD repeat-containing protein